MFAGISANPPGGSVMLAGAPFIDLVPHADGEGAGRDDHVFIGRMRVRGDGVVRRELQTDRVRHGLGRIARKDGDLGAGWNGRRRGSPLGVLRRLDDVRVGLGPESDGRDGNDNSEQCGLHVMPPVPYLIETLQSASHGRVITPNGPNGPEWSAVNSRASR